MRDETAHDIDQISAQIVLTYCGVSFHFTSHPGFVTMTGGPGETNCVAGGIFVSKTR